MKMKYIYHLIISVLFSTLFAACGAESDGPDTPSPTPGGTPGSFTISTRAIPSAYTVEGYGEVDETHDSELINNCFVIFVKKASPEATTGTVMEIIENPDRFNDSEPKNETDDEDKHTFTPTELKGSGIYDIFAFANVSREDVQNAINLTFEKGKTVNLSAVKNTEYAMANNSPVVGKGLVPMSGYRENVEITDNSETSAGWKDKNGNYRKNHIEVIRMLAKIEIKIKNVGSSSMNLSGISFAYLNKGTIKTLPDYANLGKTLNKDYLTEGSKAGKEAVKIEDTTPFVIEKQEGTGTDKVKSIVFYVRESLAELTDPSKRFMLSLIFDRKDKDGNPVYVKDDKGEVVKDDNDQPVIAQNTITVPVDATNVSNAERVENGPLTYIQRNDHVVIPVKVDDVMVNWQVLFYPPIGGYPAVLSNDDGFIFRAIFGTQGVFSIYPEIVDLNGDPIPGATYKVVDASGKEITSNLTVKDEKVSVKHEESEQSSIFRKKPTVSNGEIIGEINKNEGEAIIPVTLEIKIPGKGEPVKRSRNLYIVRKNSRSGTKP